MIAMLLGVLLAQGVTPAQATPSHSRTGAFIVTRDCQEEQAFVDGDDGSVARELPNRFVAVRDPSTNAPVLFFRGERCSSVIVDGKTVPVTMASFGVVVQSPDGTGCASAVPVIGPVKGDVPPACNWYTLGWLANNQAVVNWFHAGAPGFPATVAPGLVFRLDALDPARGGAPFNLSVPPATGSPFALNAVTRQRPGQLSVRGGYWANTPRGVIKVVFASDDLTSGDATGTVSAPLGSRVATLLGASQRPYLPGYSAIAAEHWDQAEYRQQSPDPASDTTSFSGSCSMQGTVTFQPAATNTAQALSYAYSSTGTCSGALDGREISNAPASYRLSGSSYGGCSSAQTTAPGQGSLIFDTGQVIGVTADFTTLATEVNETIYGDRSGMAPAHGTFVTQRTSPTIVTQCAGPGVRDAAMDLTLTTETPLVSDNRSAG